MFVKMHRVMCFIVTALLILLQITCQNNVEVQFLCKNEECSESIGEFSVLLNYNPDSAEKIGAKIKDKGIILAKPVDVKSTDLWKVKIEDNVGFLPAKHIKELKTVKANITVKLRIPVNTVPNTDSSKISPKTDTDETNVAYAESIDKSASKSGTDDVNSTEYLPSDQKILNESVLPLVNVSSNQKSIEVDNNTNENKDTIPLLKSTNEENLSTDQITSDSLKNDQTKNEADPKKTDEKSVEIHQRTVEIMPNVSEITNEEKRTNPDVSLKMENFSQKGSESVTVNFINESESKMNSDLDVSNNVTQEMMLEKVNVSNGGFEVLNVSQSDSNIVGFQNDSTANNLKKHEVEKGSTQNDTDQNSPIEPEMSVGSNENLERTLTNTETDNDTAPLDVVKLVKETTSELDLSGLNNTSQNNTDTAAVSTGFDVNAKQNTDHPKTVNVISAPDKVESNDETSTTKSELEIPLAPTMRTFPDDVVIPKEAETASEKMNSTAEFDQKNTTSEVEPMINSTFELDSKGSENDLPKETNLQPDSAASKNLSDDIHPPQYIETTTEFSYNEASVSLEKNIDSNESVLIETSSTESSASVADDIPPSKLSERYKYIKSQPYPSSFLNIASENQPTATEKSTETSSQEIIAEETKSDVNYIDQGSESVSSEPVTVPIPVEQKQGLNDYIHSSRKKIDIDEPEPLTEPETSEEKPVYEIILDYVPDLSITFWSLIDGGKSLVSFGSSPEENPESEICTTEQFCGTERLNSLMDKQEPNSEIIIEIPLLGVVSKEQITLTSGILTTTILATILLWWMLNYFSRSKKVSLLVSRINQLEKKLSISVNEITALENKLIERNFEAESKQNAVDTKRITEVYEHKINQYKKRTVELEDKVLYLEKELENVSNSALEMHKLLENSLVTQAQSKVAIDEMETLRTLTESQDIQIDELKKEINSVVTENQCLKVDNEMNKSTIKKLEKECNAQTKKNVELSEKNRNLTLQLDKEFENNSILENNYKSEIYELRSKLEDVEMNLKRSEFQVQELQRAVLDKQAGVQSSNNDVQLKIQISTLEAMNNELSGQLNEQKNARRMLEDHVGDITKELNNLKKSFENSEKERNQAVTKLQVLTQYFKDKEEQLHKEIEAKDKLSLERESKDQSLSQKLSLMREEIINLKIQNDELKKEVLDQEASYKVQLANAEQKTREHWFALRQAERKYKECQQEAAILRNKVLVLETSMSSISQNADDKNNSGINGDVPGVPSALYHSSLSPDLLPYPSSSNFIPPPLSPIPSHSPGFFPPEPLYSPDERLPPLGGRRAPSPPPPISPDDEFHPPPPLNYASARNSNVEPPVPGAYSRRTPPPNSRHRSQFKSRPPRSSIDSPSSGMSLESLDKSVR